MAIALRVGEEVWVPRARLGQDAGAYPHPFVRARIASVQGRSVGVSVYGAPAGLGVGPVSVAASICHRDIGVLPVRIGAFDTETTLLDPLAKSVAQFCRLLLPDDHVHFVAVRSFLEFQEAWRLKHSVTTVAVLTGHGREDALMFGIGGPLSGAAAAAGLHDVAPAASPKVFISLACLTGHAAFARPFSNWKGCAALMAPFHSVHGAVASQFAQTFLIYHLLHGETQKVAFNHARERVAGATSFRMWVRGKMLAGR